MTLYVALNLQRWDDLEIQGCMSGVLIGGIGRAMGCLLVYESREVAEEDNPGKVILTAKLRHIDTAPSAQGGE